MLPSRLVVVVPFLVLLAGCGGGDKSTKPVVPADGLPAGTPAADTPAHLAQRFEATWENQVEAQYALLLTEDFHFHFSLASDPDLASQYGENWRKFGEVAALTNLFDGFENIYGETIPGATTVDLTLTGLQYGQDFDHADSTAQYQKLVVTAFVGEIEVPGSPDPVLYRIDSRQELFLVRGDAAVLAPGAVADTTRWYIRRWDDLSSPGSLGRKGPVINPSQSSSLGSVKSRYAAPSL